MGAFHALASLCVSVLIALSLALPALADAPLQEWRYFESTGVLLPGATAACGFPVYGDFSGESLYDLFYDVDGRIIKEIDTFPDLHLTIYAPATGKSYTSASPAVFTQYYEDGAAIGSHVTAVQTGLVEKFGGTDLDAGRQVYDAFVRGYDAAGVPLIRVTATVSSEGPDRDGSLGQARCDAVR